MNADTVKNSNPNWVIPTNEENATGDDENEEVFFLKKPTEHKSHPNTTIYSVDR